MMRYKLVVSSLLGDSRERVTPCMQEYIRHIAIRMHDAFEIWASIHRDATYPRLSLDTISSLKTTVHFYSEEFALDLP
jgi:hypothetical protein